MHTHFLGKVEVGFRGSVVAGVMKGSPDTGGSSLPAPAVCVFAVPVLCQLSTSVPHNRMRLQPAVPGLAQGWWAAWLQRVVHTGRLEEK